MVEELDRALDMGAAGVGIATNIGDLELHAAELRNFWQEMNRRKLMVLVHPDLPLRWAPERSGNFFAVGYPGETAMAATKLALSGVIQECSDVKIVWSHLGGGLPMILESNRSRLSTFLELSASAQHLFYAVVISIRRALTARRWSAPARPGAWIGWSSVPMFPTYRMQRRKRSPH